MTPERVYVELDWYDGPRAGVADVAGVPHYFQSVHGYTPVNAPDEYLVWPIGETIMAWEREQWEIYIDWVEAGAGGGHPGSGGVNRRYDELTVSLEPHRVAPADARRVLADWHQPSSSNGEPRDGPRYRVTWRPV